MVSRILLVLLAAVLRNAARRNISVEKLSRSFPQVHAPRSLGLVARLSRRAVLGAAGTAILSPQARASDEPVAYSWEVVQGITPGEQRAYAVLTLSNGARGLIASDDAFRRCELAVAVGVGSLDDPPELEGLAHMTEHMTIAQDPRDAQGLQSFLNQREGEVNGLTTGRRTYFYTQCDLRNIVSAATTEGAQTLLQAGYAEDIETGLQRFAGLFAGTRVDSRILDQELGRVEQELRDIERRPSRALLKVAALKARATNDSAWRRLGRGGRSTLLDATGSARELRKAVELVRTARYRPSELTFALLAPLPLETAVALAADAFGKLPERGRDSQADAALRAGSAFGAPVPFGRDGVAPMALMRPGKRSFVTIAWQLVDGNSSLKPLEILGHALTEPHKRSLAAQLRSRKLVPRAVEVEPVVNARTIVRADTWQVWQLEIVLAEGACGRWREVVRLAQAALNFAGAVQGSGRAVLATAAKEVQTLVDAAWRYGGYREPTALELASDLQNAVRDLRSRTFAQDSKDLARAAGEAAAQMAAMTPVVTVFTDDASELGVQGPGPALPEPLDGAARLIVLDNLESATPRSALAAPAALADHRAPVVVDWRPPANPWVPTPGSLASCVQQPAMPLTAFRFGTPVGTDGVLQGVGLGGVQLPGCVERRTVAKLRGSTAALSEVMCLPGSELPRPFAVVALQLFSPVPAAAKKRQAARAELWRWTLLEALAEEAEGAARAGLRWDLSFNTRGLRLLVSGYAPRASLLFLDVLRRTLRHVPPLSGSVELAAARRAARLRGKGRATLDELERAAPAELAAELERFFSSVTEASVLLAGTLGPAEAESLVSAVRVELDPVLLRARARGDQAQLRTRTSVPEELALWSGLLYKPAFFTAQAQNACLDPAIAGSVDECGS